METETIERILEHHLARRGERDGDASRGPKDREASFDYCYNYFQSHKRAGTVDQFTEQMQLSCLHLGFYLASWGMLRGSTDLLNRSIKYLEPVVLTVAGAPDAIWAMDADRYATGGGALLDIKRQIKAALPEAKSEILVTKILLGVFGCVPAFDTNFTAGTRKTYGRGMGTLNQRAIDTLGAFYRENEPVIEDYRAKFHTYDFGSADGATTDLLYTRAKIIDMIFFTYGEG